ncbi:MAG TPA: aldolase/citrate lyase family protein [Candidatus Elarobacter sp.]|nr:aldolase/citrate lyase family protein [Candidatus Elarobacter sp.]
MRENDVARRLRAGETVLGAWLSFSDALVAEAMASVGWDWLLIDMEHGPVALADAAAMATAIRTRATAPFVRPAWNESSHVQRVLDLGCSGIIVPVVNTADDARKVVQDARFPPLGERSRGGIRTPLAFETDAMTYAERANENVVVLVQIETELAVRNVEAIVAVDGIDGVFVGPNDLASSLGTRWPDVWERDAAYMDLVQRVATATNAAGKTAGFLARDPAMASRVAAMGYRFIGVSSDANFLMGAAKRALDETRADGRP